MNGNQNFVEKQSLELQKQTIEEGASASNILMIMLYFIVSIGIVNKLCRVG